MNRQEDTRKVVKKIYRSVNGMLKQVHLFPEDASILVACSGGPDSMVLLDVLQALAIHRKTVWKIGVATMNHGIRPEGELELDMVQQYCEERNLPFWKTMRNIPAIAEEREQSLELVGRDERYQWLLEVAQREDFQYIAVAHHKDDQVETVLAHLIRGTGLQGLIGMDVVHHHFEIPIVRPLLGVKKVDILEYARIKRIPYCIDLSNEDTMYTRNFIRHRIMPELVKLNPNIEGALCRLGATVREDIAYIDGESQRLFDEIVTKREDFYIVSRRMLRKQPLAIQRRLWQRLCAPVTLSWAHQEQLRHITFTGEPKSFHISDVTIEAQCDKIYIYCKN